MAQKNERFFCCWMTNCIDSSQ